MSVPLNTSITERGFTLLEVLVSIGVFSMVALISYSTLDTYIDQRERLLVHYGKLEQVQRLFILLERDLQFMMPRKVRTGSEIEPAVVSENSDALISMTVSEADFRGASGTVLKRVQWRLDGGELFRAQWNVLDHDGSIDPQEWVVSDEVEELTFNYLVYARGRGLDIKDTLEQDEYPDGVEVIIKLTSGESYRRVFATALGAG